MDLQFSKIAWEKTNYLVACNDKEIGWFGVTKVNDKGVVEVVDIFVPEQEVTGTDWLAEKEAMADMQLDEGVEAYLDDGCVLNYMGHSHVNMGVGPSAQDEDYIDTLLEDAPEMTYQLYTTIHNKSRVVSGQVSVIVPTVGRMSAELDVSYIGADKTQAEKWAEVQTKKQVTAKTYHTGYGPHGSRRRNFDYTSHAPANSKSLANPSAKDDWSDWEDDSVQQWDAEVQKWTSVEQ